LLGDSKTQYATWPSALTSAIDALGPGHWVGFNGGIGGATVASYLAASDALFATYPADGTGGYYGPILINLGINDGNALPPEATWESNFLSIIDKIHAKAPESQIYLMRPWSRGCTTGCDTLAAWIDAIVAARPFVHLGPDERVWAKGADDGATMMVADGIHYSAAGNAECTAQWRAVLGY